MSFKITAESDLWESRGTFTLDSHEYKALTRDTCHAVDILGDT
jgi:hypothetical protein